LKTSDFDYHLPESSIAQTPAEPRDSSRLLVLHRDKGALEHRIFRDVTDYVKAGDLLFLMDKKPFQAQLDDASAALAKQKAALETARLNLDRVKPLVAQNALSKKSLDDATGVYESYAAAMDQAKAQLATAEINLSYCTITSPVTGITSAALQQDGAYISAATSQLTSVAVLSPIWVNFSLSENELQTYRDQVAKKLLIPPRDGGGRMKECRSTSDDCCTARNGFQVSGSIRGVRFAISPISNPESSRWH